MARLSAVELEEVFLHFTAENIKRQVTTGGKKSDWKILIDALDNALDSEAATINSYIPQPQRANFTVKEKALALELVIARRYLI